LHTEIFVNNLTQTETL